MNRISFPSLVALTATLIALTGCGDTSPESEELANSENETMEAVDVEAEPAAQATAALVDPNVATEAQLVSIGLDQETAGAIVAGRPYENMLAVDAVLAPQLSEPERETVYAALWKPLDLNAASEEEILLIPGIGPQMAEEFEEYRPYRAIEEFRREIGKYVDEAEVARLERYVAIP